MPHDREQLFNEARQTKRSTSTDSRRSSTTIDDNGCIITRGFVVPSRSSSQSSIARSTTSSFDSVSTPLSPLEPPSPGFTRPGASINYASDYVLRSSSAVTSLPRSIGDPKHPIQPGLEWRQTWQSGSPLSMSSSRWDDEDLETTTCHPTDVFRAPRVPLTARTKAKRSPHIQTSRQTAHIRRSKSEQTNLHQLAARRNSKARSKSTQAAPQDGRKVENGHRKRSFVDIVSPTRANDAIASDSEDDDTLCDSALSRCITARQNRLDYATRRAMTDDRNAALMQQVQQVETPSELCSVMATPIPDASDAETDLHKVSQKLELMSASLADNAIASDSEDDDYTCKGDPKTTAALKQAAIHRICNIAIADVAGDAEFRPEPQKRAMSDAALTVRVTEPSSASHKISPHKRNSSAGSLTVRLIPPMPTQIFADNIDNVETPIEVKTYEKGSILAIRSLRPSKTRPKPAKGVLKKSGSPPSTGVSTGVSTANCSPVKRVQTHIRSGSGEVVDGLVRLKSAPEMTTD